VAHDACVYSMEASGLGHELGREGLDELLDVTAIAVAPAS
jgi:hypothetical protein